MSARLPWFKCKPGPLLGAMAALPPDQNLLYLTILLRIYENGGPIKDTPAALGRRVNLPIKRAEKALAGLVDEGKITLSEGMIDSDTTHETLAEQSDFRKIAQKAGKMSAQKRSEKSEQNQQAAATTVGVPLNGKPTNREIEIEIEIDKDLSNDKSLAPAPPDADGKPKRQRKKKDSETPAILARLLKPETVEKLIRQRRRKGVTLSEDWAESLVERLRQYGTDPGEWEWAAKAIIDNDWQGFQPGWMRNIPRPESGPQPAQIDWEARVSYFAQKSQWPFRDSPAPGSPGCLAPAALLEKFNLPPTPAAAPMPRAQLQLIRSA